MTDSGVRIDCPYCNDGRSKIFLCDEGHWFCLRNPAHAGADPAVLVKKLRPDLSDVEIQRLIAQHSRA